MPDFQDLDGSFRYSPSAVFRSVLSPSLGTASLAVPSIVDRASLVFIDASRNKTRNYALQSIINIILNDSRSLIVVLNLDCIYNSRVRFPGSVIKDH